MIIRRGERVCSSIDLNFYAWYDEVQWQPSTKRDNRWRHLAQEKKMRDLQIRYHFQCNSYGPVNGVKYQLLPEGYL